MASFRSVRAEVFEKEERRQQYGAYIKGLNAFERHRKFMEDYVQFYGKCTAGEERRPVKTDQDTLREAYRFIRSEEDDLDSSWEQRLAKRYYDKLFKEYCIADMSKYKEGKIGLRWRVEKEVIVGKGQFICGNKKCDERENLSSYEVNFSYQEAGESKQALVKLRVCESFLAYLPHISSNHSRTTIETANGITSSSFHGRASIPILSFPFYGGISISKMCSIKLNYKKEKEKAHQLHKQDKERQKQRRHDKGDKKRPYSESDDEMHNESERKSRRNEIGIKSSTAGLKHEGDANVGPEFDEYFEGMFL